MQEKTFETTGHVDRTVLVPWLIGKVLFHLSYEHYMGLQTGGSKTKHAKHDHCKTRHTAAIKRSRFEFG